MYIVSSYEGEKHFLQNGGTHKDLEAMEVKSATTDRSQTNLSRREFQVQAREQEQPTRFLLIPGAVVLN